jgi:hypothetical protein
MLHAKNYSGIISEFSHTTSLVLSLSCPSKVVYGDFVDTISPLKGEWQSVTCKSMTKMDDKTNNYLLSIIWDPTCKTIQEDKENILKILNKKLSIISKS